MHVTDYYARPKSAQFGGVNSSRYELLLAFREYTNFEIQVLDAHNGYQTEKIERVNYKSLRHYFKNHVVMIPKGIVNQLEKTDFVILHEGWNLGNFIVAFQCKRIKVPYMVVPHGVYEPEVVRNLRFRFLRSLLESFVLNNANFVNIFFQSEEKNIHAVGKKSKTVVAPTGATGLWKSYKWNGAGNYAYYAGRLDVRHKGLDILIRAWGQLDSNLILILQGQDFFKGRQTLSKLIADLNLSKRVRIIPNDSHEAVMKKVEECRLFIHPSRWESYGRSVVDSLSIGTPTVISNQMNLVSLPGINEVAEVVSLNEEELSRAIMKIILTTESQFDSRKRIGWVQENFNWQKTVTTLVMNMNLSKRITYS